MTSRDNTLDPKQDIRGTDVQDSSLDVSEESLQLGSPIPGQTGSAASITVSSGTVTLSGVTGMSVGGSLGRFITVSGAATGANNGTFQIISVFTATSVEIDNPSAVTDTNNGSILWTERNHYSLESDINYERSDRANIKGVDFDDPIPTYQRPDDTTTDIPTNLANIADKTTDATTIVVNEKVEDVTITTGDGYVTVAGSFPYADAINTLGFPISDGYDSSNPFATFVFIVGDGYDSELTVLDGVNQGNRIFGVARQGTSGIDGSFIEVEFRSVDPTDPISSSIPYTWESDQDLIVDLYFGKRERLDLVEDTYLRTEWVNGLLARGGGGAASSGSGLNIEEHAALRQLIHLADGVGGPFEEFISGAFRECLPSGSVFPTSIVWWESAAKNFKIVEKTITRNPNKTPSIIEWQVYDNNVSLATVTDIITYSGVIEVNRTRNIV